MKIRRFFENEVQGPIGTTSMSDISDDTVNQIINDLTEQITSLEQFSKKLKEYESKLERFTKNSSKGNDQIDDSITNLQQIQKYFSDSKTTLDTLISNLEDYSKNGRQYIIKKD
jgi:ABC-type transporter Mla subunit MlaD